MAVGFVHGMVWLVFVILSSQTGMAACHAHLQAISPTKFILWQTVCFYSDYLHETF